MSTDICFYKPATKAAIQSSVYKCCRTASHAKQCKTVVVYNNEIASIQIGGNNNSFFFT